MAEVSFLGYALTATTCETLVRMIREETMERAEHAPPVSVACLNPHSYVLALTDIAFAEALHGVDHLIPDGVGVTLGCRLLRLTGVHRITGSDIFSAINRSYNESGSGKVFFLGSSEATLAAIERRFCVDYPALTVATMSPPFADEFAPEQNEAILQAIRKERPDVLWLGMTAPKQEKWLSRHRDQIDADIVGAVGAVFDFYAGTKTRGPAWSRKLGLEWAVRFIQEPRRLLERNLRSSPIFIWHVVKQYVGGGE